MLIARQGQGRVYYRVGLRYALTNCWLAPRDRGFVVSRNWSIAPHEDAANFTRDASSGVVCLFFRAFISASGDPRLSDFLASCSFLAFFFQYTIKQGTKLKLEVTIVNQSVRNHVVVVDYLPAAFEIIWSASAFCLLYLLFLSLLFCSLLFRQVLLILVIRVQVLGAGGMMCFWLHASIFYSPIHFSFFLDSGLIGLVGTITITLMIPS